MQPPKPPYQSALSAALAGDSNSLIERAMQLHALDRQLRQSLSEPLASHVRLGNLRQNRLVFLADTSAWASRLRLHSSLLLEVARAAGAPVTEIAVKVATMRPVPPDAAPPARLSQAARETLLAAAAATTDEDLKSRLLRLASMA